MDLLPTFVKPIPITLDNIKDCPYCGCDDISIAYSNYENNYFGSISCTKKGCGANINLEGYPSAEALEEALFIAWNIRV